MHRYLQLSRELWVVEKTLTGRSTCPLQTVLLVARIYFTFRFEHALFGIGLGEADALMKFLDMCRSQHAELVRLSLSRLSSADRIRVENMILLDAHCVDVCDYFVTAKVSSSGDFLWQSRLRFRHITTELGGDVECNILLSKHNYGFEYIDSTERIAITPIIERAYVATALALSHHNGLVVIGSTNTGKRAILRSLSSSMGQHTAIFDCSSSQCVEVLESAFSGVVACGCWGIFLHLNRLSLNMMGMFALISQNIREKLKGQVQSTVEIGGQVITPQYSSALLATFTGTDIDSYIPFDLKASFRPTIVFKPDLLVICEYFIIMAGLKESKSLARMIVSLCNASPIFIESQMKEFWSLETIKRILLTLGPLRRDAEHAHMTDLDLVYRTLRDFTLPSVAVADRDLYLQTMACCFPDAEGKREVNEALGEHVANASDDLGLWADQTFMNAVLQLGK